MKGISNFYEPVNVMRYNGIIAINDNLEHRVNSSQYVNSVAVSLTNAPCEHRVDFVCESGAMKITYYCFR